MVSNIFGFCCASRSKDDIGRLPFDALNMLSSHKELSAVFKVIKKVEDEFFFQPMLKDIEYLID
jgi:hypothetical protein